MLVAEDEDLGVGDGLAPEGLTLPPRLRSASLDLVTVGEPDRDAGDVERDGQPQRFSSPRHLAASRRSGKFRLFSR